MASEPLDSSLGKLSISPRSRQKSEPADSWEDEADASGDDAPSPAIASPKQPISPPPTPASPASPSVMASTPLTSSLDAAFDPADSTPAASPSRRRVGDDKRPETSISVASRLIAAGIGQKPQKRTKEQREYDQAMKLQEKRRRDKAREEEENRKKEKEKALRDVWDG